jgi:hypothetical protein
MGGVRGPHYLGRLALIDVPVRNHRELWPNFNSDFENSEASQLVTRACGILSTTTG